MTKCGSAHFPFQHWGGRRISANWKAAWSTKQVLEHPQLHNRETHLKKHTNRTEGQKLSKLFKIQHSS